jgi:hypothetical protein
MQSPQHSRSAWLRFCDSFLQDRNIKWILALGMAIVLGSSLMLVTSHWDGYAASLKQLIVLAYTLGAFAVGRYSEARLALRRTGTILLGLSVLLFPVAMAALHWVHLAETHGHEWPGTFWLLLALSTCLAAIVGRDVSRFFLRASQPTFLVCYLLLAMAGALVPGWQMLHSPVVALLLWGVFTVGAVKVNRHVFWLVEERQAPRIFGFFPIALLAIQFFAIFGACFARQMGLDWIGLGSVLVAATVLLSADGAARVFEQRTGGLLRPLPWAVAVPLIVTLVLCAVGMTLAASPLMAEAPPRVLVPTALLVAGMVALMARRTNQPALVWAALAALTVSYRYLPALFAAAAQAAVQQAGLAIHESYLPPAFFGLTFLPLLVALTVLACRAAQRRDELFAEPLRRYVVALPIVLLALAATHAKATLPVGLALAGLFAWQTVTLRNRAIALPALAAMLVATLGISAFGRGVLLWNLPAETTQLALVLLSALLLWPGSKIDRQLARLPVRAGGLESCCRPELCENLCRRTSLALAAVLPGLWGFEVWQGSTPHASMAAVAISGLLAVQALVWLRVELSVAALAFPTLAGFWFAATQLHLVPQQLASVLVLELLAQWLLGYLWQRFPRWRASRAFGAATGLFVTPAIVACTLLLCLPGCVLNMLQLDASIGVWWLVRALALLCLFDMARAHCNPRLAALGHIGLLLLAGAGWMAIGGREAGLWLPALWSTMAVGGLALHRGLEGGLASGAWASACTTWRTPLPAVCLAVLLPLGLASLLIFDVHARLAGLIVAVGLTAWTVSRSRRTEMFGALVLLNWQVSALVLEGSCPRLLTVFDLGRVDLLPACLPLALVVAVSSFLWSLAPVRAIIGATLHASSGEDTGQPEDIALEIVLVQRTLLGACLVAVLLASLLLPSLGFGQALLAGLAFATLIGQELLAACRRQRVEHAWVAQLVAGLAVAYLAYFGVIHVGRGMAMFVVLGLGFILWGLGAWLAGRGKAAILSGPCTTTGAWLPAVAVLIGAGRHMWLVELTHTNPTWLGINSLGILAAAAFYFWRGVVERQKGLVVLAAGILNIALALLWRELAWSDPQFYMVPIGLTILGLVELLKREIPVERHNPLRYLGALLILVSPTFHIVQGSWLHLFTLMAASVSIVLLAMGLRVRALMSTGTAFLLADLVAMVVRGSIDHPQLLWVAGLLLGAAVVALGAACELNREQLLQRLRAVGAALQDWE